MPISIALYAGVAVAALTVGAVLLHRHDLRIQAEQLAANQAAAIATMTVDHVREVAALEKTAIAAAARAASSADIRNQIHAAPSSSVCATSLPIRAALDGLRRRAADTGSRAARNPG